MRFIAKGSQPTELAQWIAEQEPVGVNLTYSCLPSDVKQRVVAALAAEQFQICAYTGKRLSPRVTAIEHVKPQSQCRSELEAIGGKFGEVLGEDLSYANMLGVYKAPGVSYGEAARRNRPVPVGPLDPTCESRFGFTLDGRIVSQESGDSDVALTITNLELDNRALQVDRASAIEGALPTELLASLTGEELRAIADGYATPDTSGALPEFAFVIRTVALSLAQTSTLGLP
jgi:uncharacterized protein (TIGR02646 family)